MRLCVIVPAYNEENRIGKMLKAYVNYFDTQASTISYTLLVVLNGCIDATKEVVGGIAAITAHVEMIECERAGKGLAIAYGFRHALASDYTHIGYVDADMATRPEDFYALVTSINGYDGIIASRYMPGAHVEPPRPAIKRWGSRLVYEPLIWLLFGMRYYDYQCGAKLFKRFVIEKIVPHLSVEQWAFDVELLYLCKQYRFKIIEVPTSWYDQAESKLNIRRAGSRMIGALFTIWLRQRKNRNVVNGK